MDYIMSCLGRFNRLNIWHFSFIDYGFALITFRDSIREWVHRAWFDFWVIDCDSGYGTEGLRSGLRDSWLGSKYLDLFIKSHTRLYNSGNFLCCDFFFLLDLLDSIMFARPLLWPHSHILNLSIDGIEYTFHFFIFS